MQNKTKLAQNLSNHTQSKTGPQNLCPTPAANKPPAFPQNTGFPQSTEKDNN
jgi:hypothetical protein